MRISFLFLRHKKSEKEEEEKSFPIMLYDAFLSIILLSLFLQFTTFLTTFGLPFYYIAIIVSYIHVF
jgi:hypothetical protein